MKRIYFILNFIIAGLLLLSACNPTKDFKDLYDLNNTIADSTNFAKYTTVKLADTCTVIKLTDANYAKSSVSNIKSNKNFSDAYPAKTYLSEIMNKSFIAKPGNQVTVNYSYYNPLTLKDSVKYTIADGEYGNTFNDYSTIAQVNTYLTANYPQATRGKTVTLTYKWYASGITTVTNAFVYLGSEWMQVSLLVAANYTTMGQGGPSFNTVDDAKYDLPIFLKSSFLPYAKAGDKVLVQYVVYKVTNPYFMLLTFDGTNWKIIDSVVTSSSVCGYNGNTWNFIPPLKFILVTETATRNYTLTDADYTLVGNGQYKDLDRRAGQSEGDVNVFLNKMATILKVRFADIAADQVYAVTYKDYNGVTTNVTVNIKTIPAN